MPARPGMDDRGHSHSRSLKPLQTHYRIRAQGSRKCQTPGIVSDQQQHPVRPGEVSQDMSITTDPATGAEAWAMLESSIRFLAAEDVSGLPAEAAAERLQALERHDAVEAAVRGRLLVVFHAQDGPVADGQRTIRSWLIHTTGVTRGQAAAPGRPGHRAGPPGAARG